MRVARIGLGLLLLVAGGLMVLTGLEPDPNIIGWIIGGVVSAVIGVCFLVPNLIGEIIEAAGDALD